MKIIKTTLITLIFLTLSVNALEIFDKECKDDGSLKITIKADNKSMVYTEDIQVMLGQTPLKGSWDTQYVIRSGTAKREYSTFQSEENVLTSKRPYPINIEYKTTQEDGSKIPEKISLRVECPGVMFTCRELNMKIESCENQKGGVFRAVLNIKGLEQSQKATMDVKEAVDFILETENKYKDITGKETTRGELPLKTQILRIQKDKYLLRYEFSTKNSNTVKTLWAGYNKKLRYTCQEDKYPEVKFYDKIECTIDNTPDDPPKEEQKTDIKIQTEAIREQKPEKPAENSKTAEQILQEQPKDYKPLAIISIILLAVLSIGGIILSYLYKRGYL